jgi:hypothetical protein
MIGREIKKKERSEVNITEVGMGGEWEVAGGGGGGIDSEGEGRGVLSLFVRHKFRVSGKIWMLTVRDVSSHIH